MTSQEQSKSILSQIRPFLFAGISTMSATLCVQPFDCLKVRIQTLGEQAGLSGKVPEKNPLKVARWLLKSEGIPAFYRGLDAGLLRQAVFGTTRLGVFRYLFEKEQESVRRELIGKQKIEYNLSRGFSPDSTVDENSLPKLDSRKTEICFWKRSGFAVFSGFCAAVIGSPIDICLVRF